MLFLIAMPDEARATMRRDDFNWTTPGEMLTLGTVCDGGERHRQECGCGRSFAGLDSAKATTFGVVAERDEDEARQAVYESGYVDGWTLDGNRQEVADLVWADLVLLGKALLDAGAAVDEEVRVRMSPRTFRVSVHGEARKVVA